MTQSVISTPAPIYGTREFLLWSGWVENGKFPVGTFESGALMLWDIHERPHVSLNGAGATGKTELAKTLALFAACAPDRYEVTVLSLKPQEYAWLEHGSNVSVATEPSDIRDTIEALLARTQNSTAKEQVVIIDPFTILMQDEGKAFNGSGSRLLTDLLHRGGVHLVAVDGFPYEGLKGVYSNEHSSLLDSGHKQWAHYYLTRTVQEVDTSSLVSWAISQRRDGGAVQATPPILVHPHPDFPYRGTFDPAVVSYWNARSMREAAADIENHLLLLCISQCKEKKMGIRETARYLNVPKSTVNRYWRQRKIKNVAKKTWPFNSNAADYKFINGLVSVDGSTDDSSDVGGRYAWSYIVSNGPQAEVRGRRLRLRSLRDQQAAVDHSLTYDALEEVEERSADSDTNERTSAEQSD